MEKGKPQIQIEEAKTPSEVLFRSEFSFVPFAVSWFLVMALAYAGIKLLYFGVEEMNGALARKIGITCLLVASVIIVIQALFKRVVITSQHIELRTQWNTLHKSIPLKDVVWYSYRHHQSARDINGPGGSTFSLVLYTTAQTYHFSSMLYSNLKELHSQLVELVPLKEDCPVVAMEKQKASILGVLFNLLLVVAGLAMVFFGFVLPMANDEIGSFWLSMVGPLLVIVGGGYLLTSIGVKKKE